MKRTLAAASCAAVALLATALTGCSGSGSSSASGPSNAGSPSASAHAAKPAATVSLPAQPTLATKSVGKLGTILVDGKGRTLYLFMADKKNKSTCTGACAVAWPALVTTGTAKAGKGVDAKLFGIAQRSSGIKQVTYNGHPLYYYAADAGKAGSTKGQGLNQFGALWYVVNAQGKQVTS